MFFAHPYKETSQIHTFTGALLQAHEPEAVGTKSAPSPLWRLEESATVGRGLKIAGRLEERATVRRGLKTAGFESGHLTRRIQKLPGQTVSLL